ncbi:unnamed protein product [Effrenium voratum]|nr:unnamed protein product [Effrenium voratum]
MAWEAAVRQQLREGQAMEAMKALMLEMRAFSERPCVLQLGIDTKSFYTDPAGFGLAMREAGAEPADVESFWRILLLRGLVFLELQQPARGQRDLRAARDMGAAGAELEQGLARARKALEALEAEERKQLLQRQVPVTVLTGFLGAGKTTLLNYMLKARHGYRYAVIENEVGQIGIDNQLLQAGNAKRTAESVVLLDNGCLCCTVRSDLVEAVKQILLKADTELANKQAAAAATGETEDKGERVLDGILIETTGLADPGPVCKTFFADEELRTRTRIDGVLTLVDACHFLQQLRRERSEDAVNESAQQVAFADKVLLNKVDAAGEAAVREVEATIRAMNALCPIVRCSLAQRPGEVPLDELLAAQSFHLDKVLEELGSEPPEKRRRLDGHEGHGHEGHGHEGHGHEGHGHEGHGHGHGHTSTAFRHDSGVGTCSFVLEKPLVLQRFTQVMNALRAERAVDLYRYKGLVCIRESGGLRQAVLQGVHDMCEFEPRSDWPSAAPTRSQLVFIGRRLEAPKWRRLFEQCQQGILDEDA